MSTANEALRAWWNRVNAVHYINETTLYVTHDEYAEIRREYEIVDNETPPEVKRARELRARLNGELDRFLGTPVIVDDAEAERQQVRVARRMLLAEV